jgi:hypothetical protein
MIPPLPVLKSVEVRDIPYVTKVEAGKDFSETAAVPIPVEEYNPYFPKNEDSQIEPATAERVVVIVQYISEKEGLEIKETGTPNAFSVWHKDLFGNVETLTSNSKPVEVKVNRRSDTFERF